jgi:hypothetical protein
MSPVKPAIAQTNLQICTRCEDDINQDHVLACFTDDIHQSDFAHALLYFKQGL